MNWSEKAPLIKAIVLDVDGVLTDGTIGFGKSEVIKFFNARDGHAIKMALRAGYKVGFLSGRNDDANRRRAEELDLSFLYLGEKDKASAFSRLLREHGLKEEECLYIGDDVVDIPVIRRAGIGVCVADAFEEVKAISDWETKFCGGRGAVQEALFRLLSEAGKWDEQMERYYKTDF